MAQLQAKQLLNERIQTQAETNATISNLINEARQDPKKFLPYGPILMNIYNKQLIDVNHSAFVKSTQQARRNFCNKKCSSQDACLNACETFFTWATRYGLDHFQRVHKYAYSPAVEEEE